MDWLANPVPRTHFSQDLLYSFGAFMTICRITRNNAEERILNMASNGWQPETRQQIIRQTTDSADVADASDEDAETDLEELGHTQIIKLIEAKFKGHNLTRLVKAILEAQGFHCCRVPKEPTAVSTSLPETTRWDSDPNVSVLKQNQAT